MKNVLLSFFKEYLRVESAFNHGIVNAFFLDFVLLVTQKFYVRQL